MFKYTGSTYNVKITKTDHYVKEEQEKPTLMPKKVFGSRERRELIATTNRMAAQARSAQEARHEARFSTN